MLAIITRKQNNNENTPVKNNNNTNNTSDNNDNKNKNNLQSLSAPAGLNTVKRTTGTGEPSARAARARDLADTSVSFTYRKGTTSKQHEQ